MGKSKIASEMNVGRPKARESKLPGDWANHYIIDADVLLTIKRRRWLSYEFQSFLPEIVSQYVRDSME
jgi:hypothetical protein